MGVGDGTTMTSEILAVCGLWALVQTKRAVVRRAGRAGIPFRFIAITLVLMPGADATLQTYLSFWTFLLIIFIQNITITTPCFGEYNTSTTKHHARRTASRPTGHLLHLLRPQRSHRPRSQISQIRSRSQSPKSQLCPYHYALPPNSIGFRST